MTFLNSYIFKYGENIIVFHLILLAIGRYLKNLKIELFAVFMFIFCFWFFRIPRFEFVKDQNIIYSPSYGKILDIQEKKINGNPYYHISTFISLFDPHIQYAPTTGVLKQTQYIKGEFQPAMFLKKSNNNERLNYHMDTINGRIIFTQIAGTLARTIVPFVEKNTILQQCQEIGLIKFGSRCDIFIPKDRFNLMVKQGQSVKGGQTIFGMYS